MGILLAIYAQNTTGKQIILHIKSTFAKESIAVPKFHLTVDHCTVDMSISVLKKNVPTGPHDSQVKGLLENSVKKCLLTKDCGVRFGHEFCTVKLQKCTNEA